MKRRWVYTQGGQPLSAPMEVSIEYTGAERKPAIATEEVVYGNCIIDGQLLDTRKKHADYLRRNDLAMASDFKESGAKARAARERVYTEGPSDVRADVEAAVRQHRQTGGKR